MVLPDGTAAVGGQFQHSRRARQNTPPIVALRLEDFTGEPAPLPDGIIGILNGQCRQRIGLAQTVGAVEDAKLADQHAHRPAVGDDVMHGDEQHIFAISQPDEASADQRPGLQIEGAVGFLDGQPLQRITAVALLAQVMLAQMEAAVLRRNALERLTIGVAKSGAQRFVPGDEPVQSAPQRGAIQIAGQS